MLLEVVDKLLRPLAGKKRLLALVKVPYLQQAPPDRTVDTPCLLLEYFLSRRRRRNVLMRSSDVLCHVTLVADHETSRDQ